MRRIWYRGLRRAAEGGRGTEKDASKAREGVQGVGSGPMCC